MAYGEVELVMSFRSILFSVFVCLVFHSTSFAQTKEGFQTNYSSAAIFTPINASYEFTPLNTLDLVFSWSGEFSWRKSDRLALAFLGGYYPYTNYQEGFLEFAIRRFNDNARAPVGGYWQFGILGGMTELRAPDQKPEPMIGTELRFGSLRASRFGEFAFEYSGGTSVYLAGGRAQVRASFNFGLGLLLGKEVLVR